MINLLQDVEGSLKTDKEKMLGMIDEYLALPDEDRRMYQAARRMVRVNRPSDMKLLPAAELKRLRELVRESKDAYEWEVQMNALIARYI